MEGNSISSQKRSINVPPMPDMGSYQGTVDSRGQQPKVADKNLWQHPFVDVFKHFKVLPNSDWKHNKKQGQVTEYFANEISRRVFNIEGSISANNYVQIPHPQCNVRSMELTGRYIYFQVKQSKHGVPFSYHVDLAMARRAHGIRISISNLFKNLGTQSGFIVQVPLELKNNCWSVVVIDIYEILRQSRILPATYLIDGSYQIKSVCVCANSHLRGIFTSNNLYDFVTLPADMRFKFAFELERWMEYFNWQTLPHDWEDRRDGDENKQLENIINSNKKKAIAKEDLREQMRQEIDGIIGGKGMSMSSISEQIDVEQQRRERYEAMQNQLNQQFNKGPAQHPDERFVKNETFTKREYRTGQFVGQALAKSSKLQNEPVMELKHIIGYQPDKCKSMKWSRQEGENVVIFTSGGTLIAMDTENNNQKRFFFGHTAPITCFDINFNGSLLASAQEGSNSVIRIWDYNSAKSIAFSALPVQSVECLSFSHDGRYIAGYGKIYLKNGKEINKVEYEAIANNPAKKSEKDKIKQREMIVVFDISQLKTRGQVEMVAKQTSEFNILSLKFSPIDSKKLVSCGYENIRFWRVQDHGNIRGSAVILGHHARETTFTCLDFEYGPENYSPLERIYVGTTLGSVYQINYNSESLETQHKTNNKAIHSISVNNDFCVTGSDDTFLRVWPLDFQEWFIEAQLEQQAIGVVDISQDGLKVVCGTFFGTIGILDKSNQQYKTLLRSHTEEIMAVDYHRSKEYIISISRDKTIRLWSIKTFDEVYEFTANDQPLSVSSHPSLPIFACGFSSGNMRIFDIDQTEVSHEFALFDQSLESLRYDNTGSLLVACCKDGRVSIHNASRQHLPVKQFKLNNPPENAFVRFTEHIASDPHCEDQLFAVMGETGNSVMIYDTDSFMLQNQILIHNIVTKFQFANNNKDLLVVTKDCKIRFYSLNTFEGTYLKELTNCHRGRISSISVSSNSGYLLTGGEDSMVKMWDYEAQKTTPFNFQSFIGHTYQVNDVIFNPKNNSQVITVGQNDGIFIWQFNGDIEHDYVQPHLAGQDLPSKALAQASHQFDRPISMLERIRTANKEKKAFRNLMKEDSFIVPDFFVFSGPGQTKMLPDQKSLEEVYFQSPSHVLVEREIKKITRNHFVNMKQDTYFLSKKELMQGQKGMKKGLHNRRANKDQNKIEPKLVNGYDGFGGVHDNLAWNIAGGQTIFTLYNKIILESTKGREQYVITTGTVVQLSCLAVSDDFKYVAVGEGCSAASHEEAKIFVYDLEKRGQDLKMWSYQGHPKGVQSITFSYAKPAVKPRFIVSIGTCEDNFVVIYNFEKQNVVFKKKIFGSVVNQVRIDPTVGDGLLKFFCVGNDASLYTCRYFYPNQDNHVDVKKAQIPQDFRDKHFTTVNLTDRLNDIDQRLLAVGAHDGAIILFNDNDQHEHGGEFIKVDYGSGAFQEDSDVMCVSIKSVAIDNSFHSIVIGTSMGHLYRTEFSTSVEFYESNNLQFTDSQENNINSSIIAMSFDAENREGLVGTEQGNIYYVVFPQKDGFNDKFGYAKEENNIEIIRLVTSNNMFKDPITFVKYDEWNSNLVLANSSPKTPDLKIYSNQHCDQVVNMLGITNEDELERDGHVVFVISQKLNVTAGMSTSRSNSRRYTFVGYSNGRIKKLDWNKLIFNKLSYKVPLHAPTEKITCGYYSENDLNFVMGTNLGSIFIVSTPLIKSRTKIPELTFCKIINVGNLNKQILSKNHSLSKLSAEQNYNQDININGDSIENNDRALDSEFGSDHFDNQLENFSEGVSDAERLSDQDMGENFIGVTSVHLLSSDPIGTMLVAFDNGKIKIWRSAVKNEQLMKIIQLNQESSSKGKSQEGTTIAKYDIATVGYQQFDNIHSFDVYDYTEPEKGIEEQDLNMVNEHRKKKAICQATFLSKNFDEQYVAFSSELQSIFIVDWKQRENRKPNIIDLKGNFPQCIRVLDATKIPNSKVDDDDQRRTYRNKIKGKVLADEMESKLDKKGTASEETFNKEFKKNIVLLVGTKSGRFQTWCSQRTMNKMELLFQSQEGLSFGAVTSLDINKDCSEVMIGTESGEMMQFDFGKKLDEDTDTKTTHFEGL